MARQIIGPRKARKLTKPLMSTLKDVRERCKDFHPPPPEDVIFEIALSEDQNIENWKAGLILSLDGPKKRKKLAKSKKTTGTPKKPKGKAGTPARTGTKRSVR